MAWKETDVVEERRRFVSRARKLTGKYGEFRALCEEFGINPKTGYKWLRRFEEDGVLADRSRRPKTHPWETPAEVALELVRLRLDCGWGPEKLGVLYESTTGKPAPKVRTIARILERAGLIEHRKRKKPEWPQTPMGTPEVSGPNDLVTVDFKGYWYTQDRRRFEPFTMRDDASRFVFCAKHLPSGRTEHVQELMQDLFREYGLPKAIRSDNGAPFASRGGLLSLTRLSVWWLRNGIQLYRSEPGHPEQNGGHERMHLDMSKEVELKPGSNRLVQQALLDDWVWRFNHRRPHQALKNKTPASVYRKSPRKYTPNLPEIVYPSTMEVRKVHKRGYLMYRNRQTYLTAALGYQNVGIEHLEDRIRVWFGTLCLGETDPNWTGPLRALTEPLPM